MKIFTKGVLLLTLVTLAFSWTAFFEKLEQLRDKKDDVKEHFDLSKLGLSSLKDMSLKDLINFKLPDLSSKSEKLKHIIPKDLDPSHHHEIDEFWTSFFKSFHLPKPTDLIECFGTLSGNVFFRKLRTMNDLLQHSKEGDNIKLHTDYVQFEMLMQALGHAHNCMFHSHDFEKLTDKLDIPNDPENMKNAKYLYFEAKYADLADSYKPIIESLDNKDFAGAGSKFADLFRASVKDFKKQGQDLLAYQAFGNGVAGTLGLPLPNDSLNCYNSKNAKIVVDFFKGLADSVVEGKWYKADETSAEYWTSKGKSTLDSLPSKVLSCDMKSEDTKAINEKLGIDVGSQEFRDKIIEYTKDHNIMFYSYLRSMKLAMDKGDYLHAGASYAHLLEAVSKSS